VFQLKKLDAPLDPGGELRCQEEGVCPEAANLQWDVHVESVTGEDNFAECVAEHVLTGRSCAIRGPPGTGKSVLLGEIRDRLEAAGESVTVLAPTNAAARIVNGCTIHAFLTRMASSRYGFEGTLLIDEGSMLSMQLVALLDGLRAGNCRIITFYDFDQLPPVGNSWRGTAVDPLILKDSALLKRWSDCTLFELSRCRRSDQRHFDFYTRLDTVLQTAIASARARYRKSVVADLHLTISHRRRRNLNARLQRSFAGEEGVVVPVYEGEPEYRGVPGTPLVGSCTGRSFVNGAFYEVQDVAYIILKRDPMLKVVDKLTDASIECTPEILSRHCQLSWSVVYNRAQGLTLRGKTVCLHDLQSRYFRRNHLYVGLSRVTRGGDIRVAP
jgi:hypothetical protein